MVIIVVNHSEDSDNSIKKDNNKTLRFLSKAKYLFILGIIDAASPGLELAPNQAGVGLARKIGMDMALPYLAAKSSLLFSTDADTTLANHYLITVINYFNEHQISAAVLGFKHRAASDHNIQNSIREYEKFLLYTANQIKKSGSPYGYVSMGSTMVCTVKAYVAIGGMPRKKATEDFYFLQEMTKFCGVYSIPDILVHPSPRITNKVYLGTGFQMTQAQSGFKIKNLYYSKYAFNLLKQWIELAAKSWKISLDELLIKLNLINPKLKKFLIYEGIETIWLNLQSSSPTKDHFIQQVHRWFDGLKTIRLLKHFTKKDKI